LCDDFPYFRTVRLDDLVDSEEVANDIYRVFHKDDGMHYIFKELGYVLYHPIDTSVVRSELTNLGHFRGMPNIVQPAGIVVARNPYMTSPNRDQPLIIRGILLQYYRGGSLKDILSKHQAAGRPWQRWGIQIATALNCLHAAEKTHMDIKPSNIVVDAEGNAVLIDLSGIGVTYEWRAPETRDILSPEELPFEDRRLYDTWGYGKLLSEIVEQAVDCPYSEAVKLIAARLMEDDPHKRMTLTEVISRLETEDGKRGQQHS
jgi:serine/threonine protein kinase